MRRIRFPVRNPAHAALAAFALVALMLAGAFQYGKPPAAKDMSVIKEVHDGDTVTLFYKGKSRRVRLIGIDTPELAQRPWGRRAMRHLEKILSESGWRVAVETDVEVYDKYGRLLAYLWSNNGRLVNLRMVEDGYAVVYTIPPNVKYSLKLYEAQKKARERKKGIWGADGLKETPAGFRERNR